MSTDSTQVAIIGAGPAGLLLGGERHRIALDELTGGPAVTVGGRDVPRERVDG